MLKFFPAVAFSIFLSTKVALAACTVPNTLTNGTTADATQVMANFTSITGCAAPLAGPSFTGTSSFGGSVGIGTVSPSRKLVVAGVGSGYEMQVGTGTPAQSAVLDIISGHDSIAFQVWDDNNLTTPRFIVERGGNVGVGTTAPSQKLEVNGQLRVNTLASASATSLCISALTNGVLASCSSSRRYKDDIKSSVIGISAIMAMRPVTFEWKGRREKDVGLIAEDLEKISPLLVTYKDGQVEGVKYAQLSAVVIRAVQEQQEQLSALREANQENAAEIKRLHAQLRNAEVAAITAEN